MFRSQKLGLRLLIAILCLCCLLSNVRPFGAAAADEQKKQTLTSKRAWLAKASRVFLCWEILCHLFDFLSMIKSLLSPTCISRLKAV